MTRSTLLAGRAARRPTRTASFVRALIRATPLYLFATGVASALAQARDDRR